MKIPESGGGAIVLQSASLQPVGRLGSPQSAVGYHIATCGPPCCLMSLVRLSRSDAGMPHWSTSVKDYTAECRPCYAGSDSPA